jgi:hypothetical protein
VVRVSVQLPVPLIVSNGIFLKPGIVTVNGQDNDAGRATAGRPRVHRFDMGIVAQMPSRGKDTRLINFTNLCNCSGMADF